MFTESLLESSAHSRRGLSTMLSFAVQTVGIAALVLLPLFYTQALPGIVHRAQHARWARPGDARVPRDAA